VAFKLQHYNKKVTTRRFIILSGLAMMVAVLSIAPVLHAQDFKQALLKMQKEYGALGSMHIVMSIKAFDKKTATTPFYSQKADIKKHDQNYFYKMGVNDMLLNEKYLLMIDHSVKQMVCNKNNLKAMGGINDPFKVNLDSLLTAFGKSSYLGKVADMEHYRIAHSKGMVKQTDLYFKVETNLLQKIEYTYESNQFVVIDFELFDRQPSFAPGTFDEGRYMVLENGKLKAVEAYRQYEIVDVETTRK
jgi:hypothetical protein